MLGTSQDGKSALILASDNDDAKRLRHAVEELGYSAQVIGETYVAARLLADASQPIVALFDVDLVGNAMAGLDHADLLGALIRDADLARRHAYVAVSHDPLSIAWTFGELLDHLGVSLVSMPCTLGALSAAVDQALAHVGAGVAL